MMELLITLLIFSLPLGVITRFSIYQNSFIYLHDVLLVLILIAFAIRLMKDKAKKVDDRILIPLLGFLTVGFVSLVINFSWLGGNNFLVSLSYLIRLIIYFSLLFASTFLTTKYIKGLNLKLIVSGSIFVAFGYAQYFFYPNLRNLFYAGWDEHLYRYFSTMLDPNFAGMFLVLIFLLLVSNLVSSWRKGKARLIYLLLSVSTIVAIYLTHSRSALVALVLGIVVMLIMLKKIKYIIPAALVLVVALFLFSNSKIEGLNPLRVASATARIDSIQSALKVIGKNPIIGVGFNSYRYAQIKYDLRKDTQRITNADAGTDNSYLFVMATTGLLGFIFFVKFIWELAVKLKAKVNYKDPLSLAAFASFMALLVNTIFINSFFYPLIMIWMFILMGAVLKESKKR